MPNGVEDIFVTPNPFLGAQYLQSLTIAPSSGSLYTGTITLSGPAPAGGANVVISANNSAAQTQSSALVPAGLSSANFSIGTSSVAQETAIAIIASYNGGAATAVLTLEPSVLGVSSAHVGNFTQGQSVATYTITVNNGASAGPTSGTVAVIESLPSGLTLISMSGPNWNCAVNTCSRSDTLAAGSSYPPITVTVSVAANASSLVINSVSVSGGSSATANYDDPTTIILPPDTQGPSLAISSPSPGSTVTTGTITVSGTASDSGLGNNGISSVTVNGVTASGGSASGANIANWSTQMTLSPGPNTITVIAKDASANQNATQVVITVTNNATFTISGQITKGGAALTGVMVTLTGGPGGAAATDGSGNYSFNSLAAGGNYTVTPSLANYTFTPPSTTFNYLLVNQPANFIATPVTYTISGQVTRGGAALTGVTVTLTGGPGGTATTDGSGNYSFTSLSAGGNYTATPSLAGYTFTPPNLLLSNLQSNQTGNFTASPNITVATSPVGLAITVDGVSATAPQTYSWTPGSAHTIAVASPEGAVAGTQYVFTSWSDSGALSHNITAPASPNTYTATFKTQYLLTTSAGTGGTITPPSGWYDSGSVVAVSASPTSGYQFDGFGGTLSGTNSPQNVTMSTAKSVTASFGAVLATADWTQKFPTNSPSARFLHAMAYDAARRQVVVFAGADPPGFDTDTWVWDGTDWTKKSPANSPPWRWFHAMAYDEARGQVVLFGGLNSQNIPYNDTWVWDGTNWTQKSPANSPQARRGHAMAYDSARGQVILFGGSAASSYDDTWVWDGTNWTQKSPASRPQTRALHAMAYDAAREQVVLFSGSNGDGDTWVWDGANWTQKSPANSPVPLLVHVMTYHATRRQVVLFGGSGLDNAYSNDTWVWEGNNWTQESPANRPKARYGSQMVYDSAHEQVVLFGGLDSSNNKLNDTWVWGPPSSAGTTNISVNTAPAGLVIVVDGVSAMAPQTYAWTPGSAHTIAVSSPQGTGTRYAFANWSDAGAISHSVTAPSAAATYTANFTAQYLLTTAVSLAGGGTVTANPPSADGYYNAGTAVQLTAAAGNGFTFESFSGGLTGSTNPQSVVLTAAALVTANFNAAAVTYTISGQVTKGGIGFAGVMVTLTGGPGGTRTTDSSGNYSFTGLPAGGNYIVTPSLAGYTFTPASATFTNLQANQTANFVAALASKSSGFDFNGDGKPDILWQNPATGDLWVWFMNGTAMIGAAPLGGATDWRVVGAVDFNGDGKPDILWQHPVSGDLWVWYMNGATYTATPISGSTSWKAVGTADFNGDGKPDILWQNPISGELWVWLINGAVYSAMPLNGATSWKVVGAADINGDGKADILWQNPNTGDLWVWYMNGTAQTGAAPVGGATTWRVVGTGDYDGDGKTDVLWQQPVTGDLWVLFMNGAAQTGAAPLNGATSWKAIGAR